MDWDDEDEKTTVYDKGGNEDAARALLAGSTPPVAPPPAAGRPPPSIAPGARRPVPGPPSRAPGRSLPPPSLAPPPAAMPVPAGPPMVPAPVVYPGRSRNRSPLLGAALVALAAAALVYFFILPRSGSLVITVSGPGNKPLDAVEIFVNDDRKCQASPCTIPTLKPDTYMVRARAAGYQPMADVGVVVSSGGKAVQNLTLTRALGTGVKVLGEGTGLKLYVDGREIGPLPQEIKDMEPGSHVIRVAGSERFETFEKNISVEPEQMQTIGPLKLRVLKGLATIQPGAGADGARVILISGSDRRTLPKLPITLDIPTDQPHTLVATKKGYDQFKQPITFDDGEVEKTFQVTMNETAIASTGGPVTSAPRGPSTYTPPTSAPEAPAQPSGGATLNMNSIPVSIVLVDGRPIGPTPKPGVHVNAGSHVIVFMNGSDRKVSTVTIGAGQTKTVVVRF